jgi:hypothetical protein
MTLFLENQQVWRPLGRKDGPGFRDGWNSATPLEPRLPLTRQVRLTRAVEGGFLSILNCFISKKKAHSETEFLIQFLCAAAGWP